MRSQGYELVEYLHEDGIGTFTYERTISGIVETEISQRTEPTQTRHPGWDGAKVLASRPFAEMMADQLFSHLHAL